MPKPLLDISVIITTFERPEALTNALQALLGQDYPKDRYEVIVVNDGGAPLDSVLRPFEAEMQLRTVSQPNRGPAAGRNKGVAVARGALIAFTDDDCEPRPDWLRALKSAADTTPDCLLGGRTINGFPQVLCSAGSQMIHDTVHDFYNVDPARARFFASNNMAAPAEMLRSLGGFDETFRIASEDRDLCERWLAVNRRMLYVPDAVVRHCRPLDFGSFLRQHFRYGRGAALFHQERVRRASSRLRDHTRMYAGWYSWFLRPWREASGLRAAGLQLLLLSWQAANLAGFVYGSLVDRQSQSVRSRPQATSH